MKNGRIYGKIKELSIQYKMSLYGLYGPQGSGKDTILDKVATLDPGVRPCSMSRILFKSIGLPVEQYANNNFPKDFYTKLEAIPETRKREILDGPFRHELEALHHSDQTYIMSNHLVVAIKNNDEQVEYL